MTESQFQSKLIRELKKHPAMAEAIIWKVADRFGGGRPDVQVFLHDLTTYFELKIAPNGPSKLQAYYLEKLGKRSVLVTFFPGTKLVAVDNVICKTMKFAVDEMVVRCMK